MPALDVPARGPPAIKKPVGGKASRGSIEVFGGAPRLVQAGVYGASSPLGDEQQDGERHVRTTSFSLPAISPADGEAVDHRDVMIPSLALRHSGRKLADIQKSFSERAAVVDGLVPPRTSSQPVRRGDAVFELTPDATPHELLMAERAAQWGVALRSNQAVTTRRSEDYRAIRRSSTDFPRPRRFSEEYRKSDYIPRARPSLTGRFNSHPTTSSELDHIPIRVSPDLVAALSSFKQTFVVSDATKPDHPIVYASAGFFTMTGYSASEVIGRNCRFLQGPDTDLVDVDKIRQSVKQGRSFCGRLLNYRKDGSAFWNLLTITPIKDDNNKVIKFIGMQVEVSKYTEGAKEKARRPNGLPESLIRYDARQRDRATESVTELVGALKRSPSPSPELAVELAAPGEHGRRKRPTSGLMSLLGLGKAQRSRRSQTLVTEVGLYGASPVGAKRPDHHGSDRAFGIRRGIDLATTLERIEKNFVITDPRLPDNPIIFASDAFLELTEYTREEILGRNCRFLQGPDTDRSTVQQIRDAIKQRRDITVQLLNYTKSGRPFWNLFHLQAMRDHKGELQYFIGVQLDGSEYVEPERNRLSDNTERKGAKQVRETARNIDVAVRELPDANTAPDDLWLYHSRIVHAKPHMDGSPPWQAMIKVRSAGQKLGLKHFKPIKPLGRGDTGSIHLVELRGTNQVYAMKAMDKTVMLDRNKVHRACAERQILDLLDHPLLPTLYASFQTATHVCLITDFCPGGELFLVLDKQPMKHFREESARFYAAEVVLALEYLHCKGVVYRDLKPENILVTESGHVQLTDFDLSFMTSSKVQLIRPEEPEKKVKKSKKDVVLPVFFAEPVIPSNSFVGTEEYIAPEIISAQGHSSAVDWWGLGVLLYEMLFGRTPFRGKNRQKTFANILKKELYFPSNIPVSMEVKLLIQGLLIRDPQQRLGSHRGANDIKSHPFFRDIKWSLVRHMTPPPLEVPLRITSTLPESEDKEVELEWDDF